MNVHRTFIHNNQKMANSKAKQIVVNPQNSILLSNKKELFIYTTTLMNLTKFMPNEGSREQNTTFSVVRCK